jgi:hypothetical protein
MVEEKTKKQKEKLDPEENLKVIEHTFDEGVRVVFIQPDRVLVEFSVLGLVYNDLFRFFTGYGDGVRVIHQQPFEDKAIKYARTVAPMIKIKKAEEVRIDHLHNAQVVLRVQKFPSDGIGESWTFARKMPYAGYKSIHTDVKDYGKGREGKGFIYRSEENFDRKPEDRAPNEEYDSYEDMKSSKPTGTKTAALQEEFIGLTHEEKETLTASESKIQEFYKNNNIAIQSVSLKKQALASYIDREKLWDSFPGVVDVVTHSFNIVEPKKESKPIHSYRLKEGSEGKISKKMLDEHFEKIVHKEE